MANKYKKKCSASLAIKEMQMKTKLRLYLNPFRLAIKKTNKQQMLVRMGVVGRNPHTLSVGM
jgi:hypothetical protein